ncbi:Cof-type HAD-IIB family hydrolase [Oceanivirga salmonicida]|uniref:Cof-type HAD-IIB family hydrolase n=1 Tax=Oceanivirga salmonicida TaxID=1769291 RepID=UPI00082FBFF5|nr:Cof-type HAD-IIB family hydrolase [Oceanivirga salmonicida]
MYKTLISDLDGTLLDANHDISDDSISLLKRLNDKGVEIILATGRNYIDARRIKDKLDFEIDIITSNGAEIITKNGEFLFKVLLNKDIIENLIEIDFKKYSDEIYMNFIEDDDWVCIEKYPENHPILNWTSDEWNYNIKNMNNLNLKNIIKIFFVGPNDKLKTLLEEVKAIIGNEANYAFTLPTCLEIFPNGINKANAIKRLNLDFNNAVAFGDGFNDLEMLRLVKKAYLMGNASYELREILHDIEVIKPNTENGMQEKLKEIFGVD